MYKFNVLLSLLALIVAQQGGYELALEALFNLADANGNGLVTLAEVDSTLAFMDPDNDGSVNLLEFTAALAANPVFAGFENDLFVALDVDKNNMLSQTSMDDFFARYDTDSDGEITKKEFFQVHNVTTTSTAPPATTTST